MLQEKKKYSAWCMKLWVFILVIMFFIWSGLIIFLVFILFALFSWNKKNKINFKKILDSIGVYDCFKHIFWDYNKWWNNKIEFPKSKQIKNYLDRMNDAIKNRALELRKKEELEKKKDLGNISDILDDEVKKEDMNTVNNRFSTIKSNNKRRTNSFNEWRSVWDDYESVIDIMNKNK